MVFDHSMLGEEVLMGGETVLAGRRKGKMSKMMHIVGLLGNYGW